MERITLISKAEVPNDLVYLINKKKIDEVVVKNLTENIGKEVFDILNSKEGKGIVEKTITSTVKDFDVHTIELTLVNEKDLIKLEKEKERLEEENKELKEKLDGFRALGLDQVIESIEKAKIVGEFIEKLQNLTEDYAGRINK